MAMLPKTVGELRKFLETYPDHIPIYIQADTKAHPNAVPERFVVEYWPEGEFEMLLLAGISYTTLISTSGTEQEHENARKMATEYMANNPNASWNQPK